MLKFGIGMVSNQLRSILDPPLLFCPTSKVDFLNPIVSFGVSNIIPNQPPRPPPFEKHLLDSAPPLHRVEPLFGRWVDVLEAL